MHGECQSPLIGTGNDFVEIANKYNINVMHLVAIAIQESEWGTSPIAQDKKNLFGIGAVENEAYTFGSFKESIEFFAGTFLSGGTYTYIDKDGVTQSVNYDSYIYSDTWKYTDEDAIGRKREGAILRNKQAGMDVKYTSDPYWGTQVAGIMYRLDTFTGGKENKKYTLGFTPYETPVYDYNPNVGGAVTKTDKSIHHRYVTINRTVSTPQGEMYEILSDERGYEFKYVYKNYVTVLPTF